MRETAGAVLETASQANLQAARKPLRAPDAVLVTDGGTGCPGCARSLGVQHEAVNRPAGQRLRGSHPIQTVNQRHRQLQQFLLPFHGMATKCLDSYLRWCQEIGLASQPSPRACLLASLAPQCTRSSCSSRPRPPRKSAGPERDRLHLRHGKPLRALGIVGPDRMGDRTCGRGTDVQSDGPSCIDEVNEADRTPSTYISKG